jgi:hypothetical protein
MPPPSNFDQAAEMNKARQQIESGDLGGFVQTQVGISENQTAAQQAHEQAAQVMHAMDSTYHDTAATQPSFAPPPSVSGGTTASGFTAPPSGPGSSGPYPGGGLVSGPGGGPTGGPISGGYLPPGLSGPGSSSGSGQLPGQYGGNYQGGAPGNAPRPSLPGTSIAGTLGGGPLGGGGGDITRNPSGRGGAPRTNFAGARVSGGGYLPKDGAGGRLSEEGKATGKGSGSGSVGAKEGAIGRGGAAASGKAGAGGAPGAGAGGGKGKKEDEEHKRKYGETEDPFDMELTEGPDGEKVVPPVIGGT